MNSKSALTEPGVSRWCWAACVLLLFSTAIQALETPGYRSEAARECLRDAIDAHVRAQFAKYGPLSEDREYFGFVFVFHGEIGSAVTKGHLCWISKECSIDTRLAVALIPRGAKVLGEWHTHPHTSGAETLSPEDVLGAYNNRHIRCYASYYSQPHGAIYAWDPQLSLVRKAMASRIFIGNYQAERRLDARRSITDPIQAVDAASR